MTKYSCLLKSLTNQANSNDEVSIQHKNNTKLELEVTPMFDRLQSVEDRYDRLNELLSDPDIVSDTNKLREYSKEQSDLQETVEAYREYKDLTTQLAEAKAMFDDKMDVDMREMVKEEVSELEEQISVIEERLHKL